MTISVTVPQLFYDLIARVIPGFLFLLMLGFELSGTGVEFIPQELLVSNSIAAILIAMGYAVLCYSMGWVLHAFTFSGVGGKIRAEHELKTEDAVSISEMYDRIRIENEAVGFRITKLRSEARMLETSRTGMAFVFIISIALPIVNGASLHMIDQSALGWILKSGVPLILAVAFRRCEKHAWKKYYDNIVDHYRILFGKKQKNIGDRS